MHTRRANKHIGNKKWNLKKKIVCKANAILILCKKKYTYICMQINKKNKKGKKK